jgi:caffeoyl-CoA O-methyltransferase
MSFIVDPKIEEYAEEHTSPDGELFERLAEETRAKTTAPQMMVGRIEGQFLATLVRLTGAKRILELGTFTGYSSISMASALPPDGRIITCDVDPEATAIARRYMDESGYGDRIEIRLGPALETIETLEGPFDLVFIDADKPSYRAYYEAALPLLAENGLIIADNVLWSGRVVEEDGDESARAIKEFNEHVRNDPRVVSVMLTVRDGMTLARMRLNDEPAIEKPRPTG